MKLTTGDIVRNEHASDDNPHKILLVLKVSKKRIYCLTLDGEQQFYYNDNDLRFTKLDSVDLSVWRRLAEIQYESNPLTSRVECVGCGADYTETHIDCGVQDAIQNNFS